MLPEFSVGPFVSLPTYFFYLSLLVSLLFFLTWRWAGIREKDQSIAMNLALLIVIAGFTGGRLLHVLFEAPEYYRRYPLAIFKFWMGGYVFYGGLALATLSSWIYLRRMKQSFWEWFDFLAPLLALGYGLGRGACFLAGCCFGRYCDLPWAVDGRHPTQAYALLLEVGIAYYLYRRTLSPKNNMPVKRGQKKPAGEIALTWLVLHSLSRLIMENYRDDFRGPMISGLSVSTWGSLILISLALGGLSSVWYARRNQ